MIEPEFKITRKLVEAPIKRISKSGVTYYILKVENKSGDPEEYTVFQNLAKKIATLEKGVMLQLIGDLHQRVNTVGDRTYFNKETKVSDVHIVPSVEYSMAATPIKTAAEATIEDPLGDIPF